MKKKATPAKSPSKGSTKPSSKTPKASSESKHESKSESKHDPKSEKMELQAGAEGSAENLEDLDADLDSPEMIAAAGGGEGGLNKNAPPTAETNSSLKNFRHHPDMENFYRFIYENDLRFEALAIIDDILIEKNNKKILKGAKAQAH